MKKSMKRIRTMIAVALVCVLLVSFSFIVAEADHDCTGEDCCVCRQLILCEDILHAVKHAVCALAVCLFADSFGRLETPSLPRVFSFTSSPVSTKVKLSV